MRVVFGLAIGVAISLGVIEVRERVFPIATEVGPPPLRHVAEDASAPLETIGIHYAPLADPLALPVWRAFLGALRPGVDVRVAVASPGDFARFRERLAEWAVRDPDRFRPVVVDAPITTWSRDRFAALAGPVRGTILAPPRTETAFAPREGDARSPFAFSRAIFGTEPRTADFVFEGGDFVSTPRRLFVGASLERRNLGRRDASPRALHRAVARQFAQEIVWLGAPGEIPDHHVMMYAVPLDDETMAVGDVRLGRSLLGDSTIPLDADVEGHARRFDRVAERVRSMGLRVVRFPVVVLEGAGAYVTYTNAVFDREGGRRVVYLPTYGSPDLDRDAIERYEREGFVVRAIDVSTLYRQNGSLGCLVNVLTRSSD